MTEPTTGKESEIRDPRIGSAGYALLALILVVTFAIRFHLRNLPLERDEGEYAYAGQLLLEGVPPYQLAYNMKLPGTYIAYAVILAVFGQTPAGIHLGVLVVNLATIFLVFLLGSRIEGVVAGVAAGASYSLLSVSPSVLGFSGHATHFVVLAATAGVLVLLRAIKNEHMLLFFASGLLLGAAFVMKQPGALFVVFGGLYLIHRESTAGTTWNSVRNKLAIFVAGATLPFTLMCLWLLHAGVFRTFWFWTVSYAAQYAANSSVSQGAHIFLQMFPAVVKSSLWLWLVAAFGLTAIFWDKKMRKHSIFVLGFLLFSFLAVCPDFLFREHYFILLLPAVALLSGIAVSVGTRQLQKVSTSWVINFLPAGILLSALSACFYQQREFFLESDSNAVCRHIYGGNPFPEAVAISNYIRQHTSQDSKIAVLGSEPEIYFYSHRRSATGYIYTYGLMEEQRYALQMQEQMIREIQNARPEVMVYVNVATSWLPRTHSHGLIYSWAQKYLQEQYELTGIADIHMNNTEYRWGADARSYQPRSSAVVFLFKRKSS